MTEPANDNDGGARKSDPTAAARQSMQAALPKRFFRDAGIVEKDGKFAVALDGLIARTPAKSVLAVDTRALAEALAAEWQALGEVIDPALLPKTRIVNSGIDGVATQRQAVIDDIVRYAGSDLLCYRAGHPDTLATRQNEAWDPVLDWAARELGERLETTTGIGHIAQPEAVAKALEAWLSRLDDIGLAAFATIVTLTGSAVLALAVASGRLEPEAAWAAAHVDEDFQVEQWGADTEAQARRAARWREMEAAATVLRLAAGG